MTNQTDPRDNINWVVLELTRQGELMVEEGNLTAWLRSRLGVPESHAVFIPSAIYKAAGRQVAVHLMEGYAFVASGLPDVAYFRLEHEPYIRKILSIKGPSGMRVLQVIPDSSIQLLRQQLREGTASDITVGMKVKVTEGAFANLIGVVTEVVGDDAFIHVALRSLDLLTSVPKIFLASQEGVEE